MNAFHYEVNVPRSAIWRKAQWREWSTLKSNSPHKTIKRNNFIDPEKRSYTKINVISTYILLSTLFGVLIYSYRKYTRKSSCTNHARWWLGDLPKYKIGFTVEALFSGKLLDGFLYSHKNTCQKKYAHKNFPGARLQLFAKVNKQKQRLVPETLSRLPRFFTLGKIIVTNWLDSPDGLLTYTRHAMGI